MKGAVRIVTVQDIPVYIHWSFGFILIYIIYFSQSNGLDLNGMLFVTAVFMTIFFCVILHEFGHALTAKKYGIQTKDIVLLPIGGIARLTHLPEKPFQEFLIALAGPLVNFAIALVLCGYFLFISTEELLPLDQKFSEGTQWYYYVPGVIALNLVLGLFNLVPAFPLDGGRIFRALLSMKWGRKTATRIASLLGQGLAIVFLIYAFSSRDVILGLVGIFVFITAAREYNVVKLESLLNNYKVADVIRTRYTLLPYTTTIEDAHEILKTGLEKWFLVEKEEKIIGILKGQDIIKNHKKGNLHQTIEQFIQNDFEKLSLDTSLKKIYQSVQREGYNAFPVYEEEKLCGVVDVEGIQHFLTTLKN